MYLRKEWLIPSIVGIVAFGGGVATGYLLGRRKGSVTQEDLEKIQEDTTQLHFQFQEVSENVNKNVGQISVLTDKLTDASRSYLEKIRIATQEPDEEESVTVWPMEVTDPIDWDWDKENAERDPSRPYILHRDEFFENTFAGDEHYTQATLTFYEGDNVLCDEKDTPIYNPDQVVGVLLFGKGSGDENVVYIRNERLEAEYEVLREPGSYEVEVLGNQIQAQMVRDDLKHSTHRIPKFRLD